VEYRNRLFNPIVTCGRFVSSADSDKSLQNAVSRVIAWLLKQELNALDWIREDILARIRLKRDCSTDY